MEDDHFMVNELDPLERLWQTDRHQPDDPDPGGRRLRENERYSARYDDDEQEEEVSLPVGGDSRSAERMRGVDWVMDSGLARQNLEKWLQANLGAVNDGFFDDRERACLLRQIAALKREVEDQREINRRQSEALLKLLDSAEADSKRLSKKDWLLVAIGAGVTLVVTELVPPLVMLRLAMRAVHLIGHLIA